MEAEELQRTHQTLNIFFWVSLMIYPLLFGVYYLSGCNDSDTASVDETFTYTFETLSILVSLVCFWLALRMLSNRSMLKWVALNSGSYASAALLRQGLLHIIMILGLLGRLYLGCPTIHWLCALGAIGMLFIWPTKNRVMDEMELYNQMKNGNENL